MEKKKTKRDTKRAFMFYFQCYETKVELLKRKGRLSLGAFVDTILEDYIKSNPN